MKQIKLVNKNIYALIDDIDYEQISKHSWYLIQNKYNTYAYTKIENMTVYMHQLVLPSESIELTPDHKNRNGLDNRRENLRLATPSQQSANRRKQSNSGKYKGARFKEKIGKWEAFIKINGKQKHLGTFKTETGAAKAYNRAAKEAFGEFAVFNIVEEKVN